MQVSCPNCKDDLDVADEELASGVAKVRCSHCSFGFTIRLGDPDAKPPEEEEKDPAEPIKLEGVKSSGDLAEAAGEIGEAQHKFISSETRTLVRVDTQFEQQVEQEGVGIEKFEKDDKPPEEPAEEEPPKVDPAAKATLLDYPAPALRPAKKQEIRPALVDDPTQPEIVPEDEPLDAGDGDALASKPTEPEAVTAPALEPEPALEAGETDPDPEPEQEEPEPVVTAPEPAPAPAEPEPEPEPQPKVEVAPPPDPDPEPKAAPALQQGIPEGSAPGRLSAPYAIIEFDENALSPDDFVRPGQGKGMRTLGAVMTVIIAIVAMLFFFVLIRNDWSLDMANLDTMINHAFGVGAKEQPRYELRGLQVSDPVLEQAKLSSGDPVILVRGSVKNNDTRARRFIYVKVTVSRHGRAVVSGTAPAANIFSPEKLAKMTKAEMLGRISSGGQNGSNARVEGGKSVDYMVVLTKVPHDFSPARYTAAAEVTEAEVPLD